MANRYVTIVPAIPGGTGVAFALSDDAQLSRWGMGSSGMGGWQVVDRPRQGATTEWVDYSPQVTMSLILDGMSGPGHPVSIEPACAAIASWELPAPGTAPPEPAKLRVTGPIPTTPSQLWVLYILTWKNAYRDHYSGERQYQELYVTLFEYRAPQVTITDSSPAAVARALASIPNPYAVVSSVSSSPANIINASGGVGPTTGHYGPNPAAPAGVSSIPIASTSTYIVRTGDTLVTIVARQLGNSMDWTLIGALNGIRDFRNVKPGQKLLMPYVAGKTSLYSAPPPPSQSPNATTVRNTNPSGGYTLTPAAQKLIGG